MWKKLLGNIGLSPTSAIANLCSADLMSVPGGGTLPTVEIPSVGIRLRGDHSDALRSHRPPIIARVHEQETLLVLRTVGPAHGPLVADAVRNLSAT